MPAPDLSPPQAQVLAADGGLPRVRLMGTWTAGALADPLVAKTLLQQLRALPTPAGWDLGGIGRLDHTGAQLLWDQWGRQWPANLDGAATHQAMLQRVAQHTQAVPVHAPPTLWQRYLALGAGVMGGLHHAHDIIVMIGQLLLDSLRLLRAPQRGPWKEVSSHLFRMGAQALPITAMMGFLIGIVIAYLSAQQLRQFGADAFIVNLLGISVVRELGPVLAAVMIAGRSGSAITAQIGVMKLTEEIDAMRVMGLSPSFRLVWPRAVALALAMPLITVWTICAALIGGMVAADFALGITPAFFMNALPKAVRISNLWLAMSKAFVFGTLIAIIGCHFGMRIKPNTESLGLGTTASVVTAITVVIIVNAIFAVVFKNVGF